MFTTKEQVYLVRHRMNFGHTKWMRKYKEELCICKRNFSLNNGDNDRRQAHGEWSVPDWGTGGGVTLSTKNKFIAWRFFRTYYHF